MQTSPGSPGGRSGRDRTANGVLGINDPVTGLAIPPEWISLSEDSQVLEKVMSGRWVLLSDGRMLRRGLTTGTTAAAACKGAVMSLAQPIDHVEVPTPAGIRVIVPVSGRDGFCNAIKDAGDHESDATDEMEIVAIAEAAPDGETELVAGNGIGLIQRRGLSAPPGKPAISRSAREQILLAIAEGLIGTECKAARVELRVPMGQEIALRTLNPSVGVAGGLSILGSSGFVEPWNEHLEESSVSVIQELEKVVVTTGRTGLRYSRVLFPDHTAVLMGSKLDRLAFCPEQESVLCGLPGLILRWANPGVLDSTGYATIAEMIEQEPEHSAIELALRMAQDRLPHTRIVLIQRDGSIYRDLNPESSERLAGKEKRTGEGKGNGAEEDTGGSVS